MMSVFFSSGQANLILIAFRPNAMGISTNEMFFAPSFSKTFLASSFIFSRSASGLSGNIFTMTAAIPTILGLGLRGF